MSQNEVVTIERTLKLMADNLTKEAVRTMEELGGEFVELAKFAEVRPAMVVETLKKELHKRELAAYRKPSVVSVSFGEKNPFINKKKAAALIDRIRMGQQESVTVELEEMASKQGDDAKGAARTNVLLGVVGLLQDGKTDVAIAAMRNLFDDLENI